MNRNIRFKYDVREFKREMLPVVKTRLVLSHTEDRLRFYIKVKNATKLKDMFVVIPLQTKKLDSNKFDKFFTEYKNALNDFQAVLTETLHDDKPSKNAYPESQSIKEFQNDVGQFALKYA